MCVCVCMCVCWFKKRRVNIFGPISFSIYTYKERETDRERESERARERDYMLPKKMLSVQWILTSFGSAMISETKPHCYKLWASQQCSKILGIPSYQGCKKSSSSPYTIVFFVFPIFQQRNIPSMMPHLSKQTK